MPRKSIEEKFWPKVDTSGGLDACWLWTAATAGSGYGNVGNHNGRTVYAHRVSYELHVGAIPAGHFVMHSCDNPPCVNPAHLSVGLPKDNTRDMVNKGRSFGRLRGVTHCKRGHEFTPENTLWKPRTTRKGQRLCRTCNVEYHREYQQAKKRRRSVAA
ncbi:MAG: hypothetical protein JWL61_5024 [Gemmatimonadetes bacterium]|jgi:hypothetical protein|nr:hypothetical protein [Gemmatimonadota bacterium]